MTRRKTSDRQTIITREQRANNLLVIDACATGLHFIYVEHRYKECGDWGAFGYATLVHNGRTVSYDPDDTSETLTDLNARGFILTLGDDEPIPPAFLPTDLLETALFNSWR